MPRLTRCERGSTSVETMLALSVLAMLVLGCAEVVRYLVLHTRMETTAGTLGDMAAREAAPSRAFLDGVLLAADDLMRPYDAARAAVSVAAWSNAGGVTTLAWQHPAASAAGGLPAGFALDPGESALVTTVTYRYRPLLYALWPEDRTLRSSIVARPRRGEPIALRE